MPKKLAIVISGAVSLGSYEAGVTYEILEALAKHNEASSNDDEKIFIDVITGASAGGMTASILAKSLLCHGATLRKPYLNPLYKAWVEEVKMLGSSKDDPGLLEVDPDEHKYSLLNIQALDKIARNVLPDHLQSCPADCPIDLPHPTVHCNKNKIPEIIVGLAMGNLNGFPLSLQLNQGIGVKSSEDFSYSQYKDRFVVKMTRANWEDNQQTELRLEEWEEFCEPNNKRSWQARHGISSSSPELTWAEFREITLSSGAFPFAFGVRQINRHSDKDDPRKPLYASRDSERKRKAFANDTDPFAGKYIYTDGGVFENEPIGLALGLIRSLYSIDENNNTAAAGESENSSQYDPITDPDRYFLFIAPGSRKASSDPFRSVKSPRADHISVAKGLVAAIMGQSRFQQWITENKSPKVLAVTSEDSKLLGDVFSAFAGFLEEKFRAYDYNMGRQTAQDKLKLLYESGSRIIHQVPLSTPLWPPTERLKAALMAQPDGPMEGWPAAMEHFGSLASSSSLVSGQRDQMAELRRLLTHVNPAARSLIREQLLARVSSLVGYLYQINQKPKEEKSSKGWSSVLASTSIRLQGLVALFRGQKAMENFAARLASHWLKENLDL